jgi:predicted DNA-binding transcriptional regulator YafY
MQELEGLLKARDFWTADDLAVELGVSRRTLHRYLGALRDGGLPIESARGRGGGLRLDPSWGLGRIHFSAPEAIDLLLSIAIAERINSPVLLGQLPALKRKIAASFRSTHQRQIRSLRKRILLGPPAAASVVSSLEESLEASPRRTHPALAEAFLHARRIEIDYVDRHAARTTRQVEPHYLFLSLPAWYLLTWDLLRGAVRHFRVDRIAAVRPLETAFRVGEPKPFLEEIEREMEVGVL